jgi:hypothetical protein
MESPMDGIRKPLFVVVSGFPTNRGFPWNEVTAPQSVALPRFDYTNLR